MRARAYLAALALGAALPALAQDSAEEDRGFLTGLIERNLSGAGQEVRLEGFAGALSSRATFEQLTIADGEGIWLTIRDGAIAWNRSALLRGRVEIGEMSAAEIEVARRPVAEETGLPEAAATPFRLPELPVSIEIGSVQAETVRLGAPILGAEVAVSLDGTLTLASGEGEAELVVERTDGTAGSLTLDAAFVNETEFLTLDLALSEPEGGIAATLLNLPGRPAMDLTVEGEGPLSDFAANLSLTSDGEPRLAGTARLTADTATDPPGRAFALDVAGDLAPLFLPAYRPFFGPDVRLTAQGTRTGAGETRLDALALEAAALTLEGQLTLAADGLPRDFALHGRIAAPGGGPVRLPVAGSAVEVEEALLSLSFDAAQGDTWQGNARLSGLAVDGDRIAQADLAAAGEIARDPAGNSVTARVSLNADGIAPQDPALAEAIGETLAAAAGVLWREGAPLELSQARVETRTALLKGTGEVGALAEGLPFTLQGSLNLPDLGAFSGLAGRPLGGRLVLALNGTTQLLDGRFDLRAGGTGRDLSAGIEPLDGLLSGQSRVGLDARRDETGITLRRLDIAAETARIAARGTLREGGTDLRLTADLDDAGRAVPGLSGRARVRAELRDTAPGDYAVTAEVEGPGGATATLSGALREDARGALSADGRLAARVADLSAYAQAAGRSLRGALDLTAEGSAALSERRFDLVLDLGGENLALGIPTADRLLGGTLTLSAGAAREGDALTLRHLTLASREITAEAAGRLDRAGGRVTGEARLRDLGLLAPDFPGPLSVSGAISRTGNGGWGTDLRAQGPGGTTATVTGEIAEDFASANLALSGQAPLGLANAAIAPRAAQGTAGFDLRLDGPPRLSSLSGRISTTGARVVAPIYGVAVGSITGGATLSGGRATIDVSGAVDGGGRVAVGGSVGLEAPNQADLDITLTNARIADPQLYETQVSGALTVTGPLAGGGLVAGTIDLAETELRLAPTGLGTGDIPDGLRHINEPRDVRLTRARAGLLGGPEAGGGGGRPIALDLLIRAPNRIFLRGRGLDAELGGTLRLGGTTANIVPQGQFDLIRGRLDILGRRLAFSEGLARLEGSFDPWIRLVATTEAEDISVRVILEGLASEPEIRFESSPELPEDEVLARLVFGRGLNELSPLQAARLASAVAQLSGRGGSGVVDRLRQNFGLDDLDITTGENGSAAVRAGRYISENVYSEVIVDSDGKADITINLDLSPSVTVRGRAGSEGDTGVGIFYERDY